MVDVSLSPFAGAGWQFFDNNGRILANGRVYTFEAGSTTPIDTYTSSAGSVSNGVYIQLDSAARPPAEVWLLQDQAYKFEVRNSTGSVIRTYDNIYGIASDSDLSAFIALLASSAGSDEVGFLQAGTNAVARTAQDKLREVVSPEDFGAAGDGTTDDTTPLTRAIATGKGVYLTSGKSYKITTDLTISTDYQFFGGDGVLVPVGNCGLIVNGGCEGVEIDIIAGAAGHTGTVITVNNADRVTLSVLAASSAGGVNNLIYVTKANTVRIKYAWAQCRGYGIKWYGDNSNRSDILQVDFALMSVANPAYGFEWDGNCNSLIVKYLGIVCGSSVSSGNGYGMIIRNTSGGSPPVIGRIDHIEVDYSGTHAIQIVDGTVAQDIDFAIPYALGATGSGLYVGTSVNDREVRVTGGKLRGNTRYGIENAGGVVLYSGNSDLQSNTLGTVLGNVWTEVERLNLDSACYLTVTGGNPVIVAAANDYVTYDRTAEAWLVYVGATLILSISGTAVTAAKPVLLPTYTFATLPGTPAAGMTAIISDCTTTTYMANAAGGGANAVKVTYLSGAWKVA